MTADHAMAPPNFERLPASEVSPYACNHFIRRLRRRMTGSGERFYRQCIVCGHGELVAKATITPEEQADCELYDSTLNDQWYRQINEEQRTIREAIQQENDRAWWAWYSAYLQSPEWRERRALVMNRSGRRCEGCGGAQATQVHHLTYQRVGHEMLFDLVAVCDGCHHRLHKPT